MLIRLRNLFQCVSIFLDGCDSNCYNIIMNSNTTKEANMTNLTNAISHMPLNNQNWNIRTAANASRKALGSKATPKEVALLANEILEAR